VAGTIGFFILRWLLALALAMGSPVEGLMVLGGSIQRERFAADWAMAHVQPPLPVIISGGSQLPCLVKIFQITQSQALLSPGAPRQTDPRQTDPRQTDLRQTDPRQRPTKSQDSIGLDRIWIEDCAESTFDNFRFSGPFLRTQGIRKIELVTSGNHSFRAILLGRIMLGAQGIWVNPQVLQEVGRPGNQETWTKTLLDTGRGLLWGILTQVHRPTPCTNIIPLAAAPRWIGSPPKCERFGSLLNQKS
jgi:uncharacterized SAM-binding protein YcdF (DUF218 family)